MGWKSSSSSESEDLDFFLVRSLVTRDGGWAMGLYRALREMGGEGERTGPRLRLPDCMLSEDNSPGLRLARAAGYTPLEGV